MTATGLLAALSPNFAAAQVVPKDDAQLTTELVDVASPSGYGSLKAYVAKPAGAKGKLPSVLVIHEDRGLNPHIEDTTRRIALDGYLALAPDALSPLGGYPGDEDKARALFATLDQSKTRKTCRLRPRRSWGVVRLCYGGGIAHMLSTQMPDLAAAVPCYGNHSPAEAAAHVKAPLQIYFAGVDDRINNAWPPDETALKAARAL